MVKFLFNCRWNLDFERTGAFYPRRRFKRLHALAATLSAYLYDLRIRKAR